MRFHAAMLFCSSLLLMPLLACADAEVNFSGTLVEEPCSLAPEDSVIDIDFGTIASKYLYSYRRTLGKPFTLHLLACDLSLGNSVSITFNGSEDADQPGLIALDGASTASGVAVGIETADNRLIPVNKLGDEQRLETGNNELAFQVFVSAGEEAMKEKKIGPGSISSNITFELNYE